MALVRAVLQTAPWISEKNENAVRYALNLARVTRVRTADGNDLDLEPFLQPYRDEVLAVVEPSFLRQSGVDRGAVAQLAPQLTARARFWRGRALEAFGAELAPAALDREVCEKILVLVCGGGGGVSYVYLGAFELIEQYGLTPRLLAGTSMGAVLQLFRARQLRYQPDEIAEVVKKLTLRALFRFLQTDSRYGLPAAVQLYLRDAIGGYFQGPEGRSLALDELAIPLLVTVTGLRNGALPRDPSYYEHLLDLRGRTASPNVMKRMTGEMLTAIGELFQQRDRFARLYLGADGDTGSFDAIDAVGFSSALPGVVHYDMLRDDERMHTLLETLFQKHGLFRLVDGGLVDNLPARAAWGYVQRGMVGTRNALVLALDGFAPKLSQPFWYGLEQLAAQNVARNQPFIHVQIPFQRVLSPMEIVPAPSHLKKAIQAGKEELLPEMPLVARMCRPFPALV
jgi:predicted acylesterase/phospholipase RssA